MTTWLNDFCRFVSRLKNYHPLKSNLTNNLGVKTPESLKSAAAHLQRISGLVSSCHCGVLLYGKFIFSLLKLKVIALSLPFRWDFLLFFLVDIWRNLQGQRKAPDMFFFSPFIQCIIFSASNWVNHYKQTQKGSISEKLHLLLWYIEGSSCFSLLKF